MVTSLSLEEKIILLASQLELEPSQLQELNSMLLAVTDWEAINYLIKSTGSAPLIYKNFIKIRGRSVIPLPLLTILKKKYIRIFFDNSLRYRDLEPVIKVFNSNTIDFIPLKGILLAQVMYKDIGLRSMCDMDILVRKKDIEKCRELILGLGWQPREIALKSEFIMAAIDHQHPYTFVSGNSTIELHDDVHSSFNTYKIDINECWKRALPINFLNGFAYTFAVLDTIIHLCTHLCRHIIGKGYNIKHYCDIAEILRIYKDELDWERLVTLSKKYNCWNEVRETLLICNNYFNAPVNELYLRGKNPNGAINYEFLFLNFFRKDKVVIDNYLDKFYNSNLHQIQHVKGSGNKIRFLLNDVFPSSAFMMRRYKIKNRNWLLFYYPVRIWSAIGKLIKLL